MDLVYIPGLEGASGLGASPRYLLVRAIPDGGRVELRDRCVTRVEAKTSDPLELVFPPAVSGAMRDFFVRLVVTADEAPEIVFAPSEGEAISFEDADADILKCEVGVNVFSFTETDQGVFIVNRRSVDIELEVGFDPCGGTVDAPTRSYKLGAAYGSLPKPYRDGYVFEGWYTAAEGGVRVAAGDTAKSGVARLYARWSVYVDPFVDAICPARNLQFLTSGKAEWFRDETEWASEPASARSGWIGDNESTSLTTSVEGPGTLSFKWKVSSEGYYDKLLFIVDGNVWGDISGTGEGWRDVSYTVAGEGRHTVEWRYEKDGSASDGEDCAWVDDVVWTGGS